MADLKIEYVKTDTLQAYVNNAKEHPAEQVEQIKKSIEQFGFNDPIAIWHDNEVIEGHGRLIAATELGLEEVPIIRLDDLTDEQRRAYMLVHNKLTMNSDFNLDLLALELDDITNIDMTEFGFQDLDLGDIDPTADPENASLQDKFLVPPFSILDARQGYWLDRKRLWRERIGDEGQARDVSVFDGNLKNYVTDSFASASILDPVLCEIVCKWFTPGDNSNVFDVFAGDTVFGWVSSFLGHNFTGIELRKEQADFNTRATQGMTARYICDDGQNVLQHIEEQSQDMLFSCPPYFDLEVYSELENDASNQDTYEDFYKILDTAFSRAIKCLKDERFAVIVVGDVRNRKTGTYYGFPDDIKATFKRNGMECLNEIILIDPIGTARLRASRYMDYRKVAKVHQNVLVFYKGDAQKVNKVFPRIEVDYGSENLELE